MTDTQNRHEAEIMYIIAKEFGIDMDTAAMWTWAPKNKTQEQAYTCYQKLKNTTSTAVIPKNERAYDHFEKLLNTEMQQVALEALAKETGKPYALLKTNYDAGDQLTTGRVNDLLGIKATRRETQKNETSCETKNETSCETENETSCETPETKSEPTTPEPITPETTNETSCENKKAKASRTKTGKALTPAERMKRSRDRKRFPEDGTQHSGKMVSVMLSGEAHSALNDLLDRYRNKFQKEIIEQAIIYYNQQQKGA
jgi:hypothetical protein